MKALCCLKILGSFMVRFSADGFLQPQEATDWCNSRLVPDSSPISPRFFAGFLSVAKEDKRSSQVWHRVAKQGAGNYYAQLCLITLSIITEKDIIPD